MNEELRKELTETGYKGDFTLDNLITACGDKFDSLRKTGESWSAYYDRKGKRYGTLYTDSPLKAVSYLYLLNQGKTYGIPEWVEMGDNNLDK